jgi:uncharacterized protein YlxW (UPF0749 family)
MQVSFVWNRSPQEVAEAKKATKEVKDLRASVASLSEEVQKLGQQVKNSERRAMQREEAREKDARGALEEVKEEVGRVEERARRRVQVRASSV